ncbi:hypothetical protein E4U43_007091 [Claviceps pusilla]|uniref:Uncharacterized protein n=1 Tax=Claviceps pusilla TaxID=123648 RepID=A0A9P7SYC3_9HYPO|nr:hypothetical protein E4U43_007091 [Claviceps pusilla]
MAQMFAWSTWSQSFLIPKPALTEENLADQLGKVHIVTGGYAGVGKELVDILYQHNATVYVAGRSPDKANAAIDAIRAAHPSSKGRLEFLFVDLSDLTTITPAVQEFTAKEKRLDVLVNNAAVAQPGGVFKGRQGYELHLVTNCLGPFLLTKALHPLLKQTAANSPPASVRVIWASSLATNLMSPAGGVMLGEDGGPVDPWFHFAKYGQSKAINLLYAVEFHRRYAADGILSVAFNPGNLKSELMRHVKLTMWIPMMIVGYPPRYGAYTELYCGWSPDLKMEHGGMFVVPWGRDGNGDLRSDVRKAIDESRTDEASTVRRLWDWSEKESSQYL